MCCHVDFQVVVWFRIIDDDDWCWNPSSAQLVRESCLEFVWCKVAWTLLFTMLSDFVLMLVIPCWIPCCLLAVVYGDYMMMMNMPCCCFEYAQKSTWFVFVVFGRGSLILHDTCCCLCDVCWKSIFAVDYMCHGCINPRVSKTRTFEVHWPVHCSIG